MADHGPQHLSPEERKRIQFAERVVNSDLGRSAAAAAKLGAQVRQPTQAQREMIEALRPTAIATEQFSKSVARMQLGASHLDVIESFRNAFPRDFGKWFKDVSRTFERFTDAVPKNLLGNLNLLENLAVMSATDGIAVAWAVPEELFEPLLDAPTVGERLAVILANRDSIEEHCLSVLDEVESDWASAIRDAVAAAGHNLSAPAQSHLANLIDSVVLAVHYDPAKPQGTGAARRKVSEPAKEPLDLDAPLPNAVDQFVVMPFARVFEPWWPGSDVPDCLNRHATSHALGEPGIFDESWYMLALLLSTSIVRHFADHPRAR